MGGLTHKPLAPGGATLIGLDAGTSEKRFPRFGSGLTTSLWSLTGRPFALVSHVPRLLLDTFPPWPATRNKASRNSGLLKSPLEVSFSHAHVMMLLMVA